MKKTSVLMLTGLLVAGTLFAGCAAGSAGSGAATAEAVSVSESEPETETETEPEVEMTSDLQETEDAAAPEAPENEPEETPEVTAAVTPAGTAADVEEEPIIEEEDPYVGSYTGNGAAILIDRDADTYYVQVRWSINETESAEWTMSGSFDANGTLAYSNATKVATVTDETGASTSEEVYTGGSGSITVQDGTLTWADAQEGIASGITYTKS